MIKSMTGYGRAVETVNGREFTVELRSVNNRYLDCSVREIFFFLVLEIEWERKIKVKWTVAIVPNDKEILVSKMFQLLNGIDSFDINKL